MGFDLSRWARLEHDGVPIYVRGDKPDWFAPNAAGDKVLQELGLGAEPNGDIHKARFLQRLGDDEVAQYPGRAELLSTERLEELWFHVTNRCNLACSHCLFSSEPTDDHALAAGQIRQIAEQAWRLGCRVFALTGGEPLVHPEIEQIVDHLLSLEGTDVVMLTNGLLLSGFGEQLARWPSERLHLQVSLDGRREAHDRIRGEGTFDAVIEQLAQLKARGVPFTISMCVQKPNVQDMPAVVNLAAETGAANMHFIWYFRRGRGDDSAWASPDEIFEHLREAQIQAEQTGVTVDNIEALASRVFAPVGSIHDGSSAGWESLAIGPDGKLYPSAALIGVDELAVEIDGDLASAWRGSPVLQRIRSATAAKLPSPMRFITGGGDLDHSYTHAGELIGSDPYQSLHEKTALWLIARAASRQSDAGPARLRLKMGDILESCGPHGAVATVHNNCLLAIAGVDGRTSVKQFYAQAVQNPREEICNPVSYPQELVEHIPEASRVRNYGCGSPVVQAGLQAGDCVVDLGCGTGIECLIASKLVGPSGKVIGVDMLDGMLRLAGSSAEAAAQRLGYSNVEFRKGYLEELPVADASVDVVVSNCVLNLSSNKRRTFAEILRVLRPGGRLMVSDVVCETEPGAAIRNDERLRGQCIAGALTQRDLFGLLDESGFVSARVLRRFPYGVAAGHPFFSMTFEAHRPALAGSADVMYRGPAAALVLPSGAILPAGMTCRASADDLTGMGDEVLVFDSQGRTTGAEEELGLSCGCCLPVDEPAGEPSCQGDVTQSSACCATGCCPDDQAAGQAPPGSGQED